MNLNLTLVTKETQTIKIKRNVSTNSQSKCYQHNIITNVKARLNYMCLNINKFTIKVATFSPVSSNLQQ